MQCTVPSDAPDKQNEGQKVWLKADTLVFMTILLETVFVNMAVRRYVISQAACYVSGDCTKPASRKMQI